MSKIAVVAAAGAVMLALAGCATPAQAAPQPGKAAQIVIDVGAASPGSDATLDAGYLEDVRHRSDEYPAVHIAGMSDSALLVRAAIACVQLDGNGGDLAAVRVIDGEAAGPGGLYWSSAAIAAYAATHYCTEWTPDLTNTQAPR